MDARVSDVLDEHSRLLLPIEGYENFSVVTLEEAVQPLISFFPEDSLMHRVSLAKARCQNLGDSLSQDESASIMLYTMGWSASTESFYSLLNTTLRLEDRDSLKPWFRYLRLFIGALSQLPPVNDVVYRGVRSDLSSQYPRKSFKTWWGFSSCTDTMNVLENQRFCGKTGPRTIFNIRCLDGRDIRKYSYFQREAEILLLPGRYFEVQSDYHAADGLVIINLIETIPEYKLLKLPHNSPRSRFVPGLSLLGSCCNSQCAAHGKEVMISLGFRDFNLLTDADQSTSKCPICSKYVDPYKIGFHRCQWRISGKKQRLPQAPTDFSTEWKSTNNESLFEYNLREEGIIWRHFIIEVRHL